MNSKNRKNPKETKEDKPKKNKIKINKNNYNPFLQYQYTNQSLQDKISHLQYTSKGNTTQKNDDNTTNKIQSVYSISTYKSITSIQNLISSIHFQHTNTFTSNNIHVSEVHCGSAVRFSQALPGFLITAHHLYASLL